MRQPVNIAQYLSLTAEPHITTDLHHDWREKYAGIYPPYIYKQSNAQSVFGSKQIKHLCPWHKLIKKNQLV